MGSSTGKGGQRKYGRGMRSPSHARYIAMGRRETNKKKRIKKHLKKCVNDHVARKVLKEL